MKQMSIESSTIKEFKINGEFRKASLTICKNPRNTPGLMMQGDFSFSDVASVRGFVALFTLIDCSTRYPFGFPCRNKSAPVDIMRWLQAVLTKQDRPITFLRVDEDGALARSTEFLFTCYELGIVVQTTGGYSSWSNGVGERPNRTIFTRVHVMLLSSGHNYTYWCFACCHFINMFRRLYSKATNSIPYFDWHKKKASFYDFRTWGCPGHIVHPLQQTKRSELPSTFGYFLGYGSTTKYVIVENGTTGVIGRHKHFRHDENYLHLSSHDEHPINAKLLRHMEFDDLELIDDEMKLTNHPFLEKDLRTFTLPLPKKNHNLWIKVEDDQYFHIPYISCVLEKSVWFRALPKEFRTNSWIVGINDSEPITCHYFLDYLDYLRRENHTSITLTLSKRKGETKTQYAELRSHMEQVRPIISEAQLSDVTECPSINYVDTDPSVHNLKDVAFAPSSQHMVELSERPTAPEHFGEMMKSPLRSEWKLSMFANYDKNHSFGVLSRPFRKNLLPDNVKVHRVTIGFRVKSTDIPNTYDLSSRTCLNGAPMVKGLDFDESHSPVVNNSTLFLFIGLGANNGYFILPGDVINAFQNTVDGVERLIMSLPPYYIEWWNSRFPNDRIDGNSKDYVVEVGRILQGRKDAGRKWYQAFSTYLEKIGFSINSRDGGLFVWNNSNSNLTATSKKKVNSYLLLSTDDFLQVGEDLELMKKIGTEINRVYPCKTKEGNVIKYLNLRIIQSPYAVSIDQTEEILLFVKKHYPNGVTRTVTPIRTDDAFEHELQNSPTLLGEDLNAAIQQFGGTYKSLYGSLIHFMIWTRVDICYAMTRLGNFQASANRPAFEGLHRVIRWLGTYPNRPIFFKKNLKGKSNTITVRWNDHKTETLTLGNGLEQVSDAAHGNIKCDRSSYGGCAHLIGGTAFSWKGRRQLFPPLHPTHSEINLFFFALVRTIRFRLLLRSVCMLDGEPTITHTDNKSTMDIVQAQKITPRIKHIDLPIRFLQQHCLLGNVRLVHDPSRLMMVDFISKAVSGPTLLRQSGWVMGHRFVPPVTSEHYKELERLGKLNISLQD